MKIGLFIENAFSYAGTENVCNFMCEVYGKDNIVDVLSLGGEGEMFYPFQAARNIYSAAKERHPRRALFNKISVEKYDYIFVIGMGRLSVEFAMLANLLLSKSVRNKTKFIACEHVALGSFSKSKRLLKIFSYNFTRR